MKKTYKESWFWICGIASIGADRIAASTLYYSPSNRQYANGCWTYNDNKEVVILQSERQSDNYVIFEVMYKEDYDKYLTKDLKYIEDLEDKLKHADDIINWRSAAGALREMPRKPLYRAGKDDDDELSMDSYYCGECYAYINIGDYYCSYCGQQIDWSISEGENNE